MGLIEWIEYTAIEMHCTNILNISNTILESVNPFNDASPLLFERTLPLYGLCRLLCCCCCCCYFSCYYWIAEKSVDGLMPTKGLIISIAHHTVGLSTNALYLNTNASGTLNAIRCKCICSLIRWRKTVVGIGPDRFNVYVCSMYIVQCLAAAVFNVFLYGAESPKYVYVMCKCIG